MHPDLIALGPFTLHTYGLFVALGFLSAAFLAQRRAAAEGLSPERFLDLVFWIVFAGLAGARALYVAIGWREYAADWWGIFRIWDGGLVFYGGFALAALVAAAYIRRMRWDLWRTADLLAPYIPLGHALGRVGCFFAGCCYGLPSAACGVVFPVLGDAVPRLPTQLYEAAGNFLLFGLLLAVRSRRRFAGQLFWGYIALYSVLRFALEFLRGDAIRGTLGLPWLHTSQAVAILAFGLAVTMLIRLGRRSRAGRHPAEGRR